MRRFALVLVFGVLSCTERALEIPLDMAHDLNRPVDLSMTPDLTVLRDLSSTDLSGDMFSPPPNPCPAGTNFIFTIDESTELSRFNPISSQFFDVGTINCPSTVGDTPNSMAIDRQGNGWVNYQSGSLFRLLTGVNFCTATPYVVGQHGFVTYGMSFAENTPGSTDETLFVTPTADATARLASIDLNTFVVSNPIDIPTTGDGELTGDDQANLWGFFPDAALPFVARIDKTKGTLDRRFDLFQLAGTPLAWGFAAFQGNFFIFLQRNSDASSTVYKLDGTTGEVTIVASNTGRHIVGVGVATCAGNNPDL